MSSVWPWCQLMWTRPRIMRRHQIETFSDSLASCAENSPVTGEFPAQRPVTRSFGVFFDLRLNKRLSKQSWGWWFERPSRSLWRHCNDPIKIWAHKKLLWAALYEHCNRFAYIVMHSVLNMGQNVLKFKKSLIVLRLTETPSQIYRQLLTLLKPSSLFRPYNEYQWNSITLASKLVSFGAGTPSLWTHRRTRDWLIKWQISADMWTRIST